jgi:hypothetical protein
VTVTETTATAPAALLEREYVQVEVSAVHDRFRAWQQPVRVTFRRDGGGWKTIGLERMSAGRPVRPTQTGQD